MTYAACGRTRGRDGACYGSVAQGLKTFLSRSAKSAVFRVATVNA
jgi:hypothetical protein